MKPIKLKIKTKTQEYSIIIGSNLVSNIAKITKTVAKNQEANSAVGGIHIRGLPRTIPRTPMQNVKR